MFLKFAAVLFLSAAAVVSADIKWDGSFTSYNWRTPTKHGNCTELDSAAKYTITHMTYSTKKKCLYTLSKVANWISAAQDKVPIGTDFLTEQCWKFTGENSCNDVTVIHNLCLNILCTAKLELPDITLELPNAYFEGESVCSSGKIANGFTFVEKSVGEPSQVMKIMQRMRDDSCKWNDATRTAMASAFALLLSFGLAARLS